MCLVWPSLFLVVSVLVLLGGGGGGVFFVVAGGVVGGVVVFEGWGVFFCRVVFVGVYVCRCGCCRSGCARGPGLWGGSRVLFRLWCLL